MAGNDENRTEDDDLPILADDAPGAGDQVDDDQNQDDGEDDYDILSEMADDERHVLSMLTDEERAEIGMDDGDGKPDAPDPDEGSENGEDEGEGDEEPAKEPEQEEPAPEQDQASESQPTQVELTQDEIDQIAADIKQQRAKLREKWRDGDLTDQEFDDQDDALVASRESAVEEARAAKAKEAEDNARQQEVDAMVSEARTYFADYPDLGTKAHIYEFDRHVGVVTSSERYANMSPRQKLEAAHKLYVAEGKQFGFDVPGADAFKSVGEQQKAEQKEKPPEKAAEAQPAPKPKPKPKRPEAPKTLANVPAAQTNSAVDGKYGQLEHIMMHGSVDEQIAALDRLPADERERFASMMIGD